MRRNLVIRSVILDRLRLLQPLPKRLKIPPDKGQQSYIKTSSQRKELDIKIN